MIKYAACYNSLDSKFFEIDSEIEMIGYGGVVILLDIGIYFLFPTFVAMRLKSYLSTVKKNYTKIETFSDSV